MHLELRKEMTICIQMMLEAHSSSTAKTEAKGPEESDQPELKSDILSEKKKSTMVMVFLANTFKT